MRMSRMNAIRGMVAVVGLVVTVVVSPGVRAAGEAGNGDPAALWALLPIGLYAALAISGMGILSSTLIALASGLLLDLPPVPEAAGMVVESLTNQVTVIGVIIALGAGVGGVLQVTGVARTIVAAVLGTVGDRGPRAVGFAVMLACLVLVAALGTLAGALAIAAPLLIPVAARLGYTRTATATLMFIGGCAGLALAPFGGSNVAIMGAADVSYGSYILYGAGPLAIMTLIVGLLWVPVVQKRSARVGDFYDQGESRDTADAAVPVSGLPGEARIPTIVFGAVLLFLVMVAIFTGVGILLPIVALPVLATATALSARTPFRTCLVAFGRGMWSMAGSVVLFWLLALMFVVIDRLSPFDAVLNLLGPQLESSSPFLFALIVALIGWAGVPGATAAQVVLINQVFGPLATQIGISAGSWVVVLLFSSKADTYGPFPNPNMVGAMGLARSTNLRTMLLTGWVLLVPVALMYTAILFVETR